MHSRQIKQFSCQPNHKEREPVSSPQVGGRLLAQLLDSFDICLTEKKNLLRLLPKDEHYSLKLGK